MTSEQNTIYIWVPWSFVTECFSGFTMARIQLVLLALLATSISVRAMSIGSPREVRDVKGEVEADCEIFLQWLHFYLH